MITIQYFTPKMNKQPSNDEQELYWKYKNELWQISGDHPCSKQVVDSWYYDIMLADIYLIRILDKDKQVGFMFIGVGNSCHPDADYYIWDAYILPEYRKQQLMTTAFQTFVKGYKKDGKYCLFLIDNNMPAVFFWQKQFEMLGYKECGIDDYEDMETPWCHIHAYSDKLYL